MQNQKKKFKLENVMYLSDAETCTYTDTRSSKQTLYTCTHMHARIGIMDY